MRSILLLTLFMSASTSLQAEMFKCVDPDGNVSFQGEPCSDRQVTEWQRETEQQKQVRLRREEAAAALKRQEALEERLEFAREEEQKRDRAELYRWSDAEPTQVLQSAVNNYLAENLKDPSSLKDLEWVKTITDGSSYKAIIRYRAKNSFNAYGLSEKLVKLDGAGQLTFFGDLKPIIPIQLQ